MGFATIEELLTNVSTRASAPKGKRAERKNVWDKFYTLYAFDEIKYHVLCEENPKANRYKLRNQCYALDDNGNRQPLGDEKYILSYKKLRNVMQRIAMHVTHDETLNQNDSITINYPSYTLYIEKYKPEPYKWFGQTFKGQNFTVCEVEIKDTWQMSIKERYLRHWYALKLIESGESVENACRMAKSAKLKGA